MLFMSESDPETINMVAGQPRNGFMMWVKADSDSIVNATFFYKIPDFRDLFLLDKPLNLNKYVFR